MDREYLKKELEKRKLEKARHYTEEEQDHVSKLMLLSFYDERGLDELYSICMEELAELTQQISKVLRCKIGYNDIGLLEELSDVELSLHTLKMHLKTNKEDLQYIKDIKLDREKEAHKNLEKKLDIRGSI